jgi:hypothetical protein
MVFKKCVRKAVDTVGINAEMHCYVSVVLSAQLTCSHTCIVKTHDTSFVACLNLITKTTVDFYCAC